MGQRTNLLLQIEGRSGARLNRVYHLQWGYRKYLPMAFLHILSSRYFKPEKPDIFEFYTHSLKPLEGITIIERDWSMLDFNKLDDCQEVLNHCDNNNGAMVVIITEDARDYYHPKYKLGFLLGSEDVQDEPPFSRWVSTEEFMRHQPKYKGEYDDIFAHAFDALTILSGTQHIVQLKETEQ